MLSRLTIQNYAIISDLTIEFKTGLNVITGETGAGKSIIVGALGLILGQRADSSVLLNKEKKCVVEGLFSRRENAAAIHAFLQQHELDDADELIVRREIAASGKSRAFINDTPVNLSHLSRLSQLLVDLHQQFDTLELGETDFQVQVLDALAGNAEVLKSYREKFSASRACRQRLEALRHRKTVFQKELDYHQFQFNELEEAALKENELEELEEELKLLSNADEIKMALSRTIADLNETEAPLLPRLKAMSNELQKFSSFHHQLPPLAERLQSVYVELQDLASELDDLRDRLDTDPARMEAVNERLALGYKLLKKHGVKTTAELLQIKNELEQKLQQILNIDEEIEAEEKLFQQLNAGAEALAAKISAARKKQIRPFEEKLNQMLVQVGMPNARLKVKLEPAEALQVQGKDIVEFLFNANVARSDNQATYLPVRKVASGGELSRLMLCIKSFVASSVDLPTLIFDEIDTGISGEAARQVGLILKQLSAGRQIICITHQPQLAGRADAHYFVYKEAGQHAITTSVKLLTTDERIVAIAKMLSGEKPTAAALENARELVMN